LVLFSVLLVSVAGAFLFQQIRYARTAPPRAARVKAAAPLPGAEGDVVLEIGGGPAPVAKPSRVVVAAADPVALTTSSPESGATASDASAAKTPQEIEPPALTVKLRRGDSLSSVAKKYYRSSAPPVIRDLVAANKLGEGGAKVREGALLTLPATAGGRART